MGVRSFFWLHNNVVATEITQPSFYVTPGTRHHGYHHKRGLGQIRLITYTMSRMEWICLVTIVLVLNYFFVFQSNMSKELLAKYLDSYLHFLSFLPGISEHVHKLRRVSDDVFQLLIKLRRPTDTLGIAGLSFGHFSGNHKVVDLPE